MSEAKNNMAGFVFGSHLGVWKASNDGRQRHKTNK